MPLPTPPPFDPRRVVNHIRAYIRIQTPPEFDPRTGTMCSGMLFGFDTAQSGGPADDLLSVSTSKRITEPGGRFVLEFTPREPIAGYNWADLIPGYSLVEIWLQRYPQNPEPVLVMLGLTGARQRTEDYSQAEPVRTIQVSGRELSAAIFVDQQVLYLPVPPESLNPRRAPALDIKTVDQFGRKLPSMPATVPAIASPQLALFGMLAIDPQLAHTGASPVDVIDRFVKMITVGLKTDYNKTGLPLLNFEFPDAKLKDLLFFDAAKAKGLLFDPWAQLPASAQLGKDQKSLWSLVTTWCDPTYQELWGISRDLTIDNRPRFLTTMQGSAVEMIFRKKPFGGRIDANGEVIGVRKITGSQFDEEFETDPTQNVAITDQTVINMTLTQSVENVRNLYYVYPQVPNLNDPQDFRSIYAPLMDDDPTSPSNVRRFGPRLMELADYYLRVPESVKPEAPKPQNPFVAASARSGLLREWHKFEPLFYHGRYTLKGDPMINIGMRAIHVGRGISCEYYTTGVAHAMTIGTREPTFTTALEVERGWSIS